MYFFSILFVVFVLAFFFPLVEVMFLGALPLGCFVSKGALRKYFLKLTAAFYAVHLFFLGFVIVFHKPIFQGKMPFVASWIFGSFAPKDLDRPLFKVLASAQTEYQMSFRLKYFGYYQLMLDFPEHRVPTFWEGDRNRIKENVGVKITIKDKNKIVYEKNLQQLPEGYLGQNSSGFLIYGSHVPDALDFGRDYTILISFSGEFQDLISLYGPAWLTFTRSGNKFAPAFTLPF